ncbi:MAG TPA: TetR family transcriptional regulator [Pseudonocardiaceae bacterium]|jgi:AcrR family transcriptional regulator
MIDEPAFEDLTARARIRDAALRLFAERGMQAATIRDIAARAGVSLGLVRHHFGSKEELRDACDEYALAQGMRIKNEALSAGMMGSGIPKPGFLPEVHPTLVLLMQYFARSISDGSAAAEAMFEQFVAVTEAWVAQQFPGEFDDPKAVAVLITAMQMGPMLLHQQVSAALGVELLSRAGHIRSSKAFIDIYAQPWLSKDSAEAAKAAYDQLEKGETP